MSVAVVPRSSRDALAAWHQGVLRVRLRAAPVEGAANEALVALLAKSLGVPRDCIQIRAGKTSRRKVVSVQGISPEELDQRLTELTVG
ncbi:MAG TPA: hypothetical protein DCY27_08945 [Desulfobacterales bacterium]|nr:hypothetical protein [Desulfobacterales bacterium]